VVASGKSCASFSSAEASSDFTLTDGSGTRSHCFGTCDGLDETLGKQLLFQIPCHTSSILIYCLRPLSCVFDPSNALPIIPNQAPPVAELSTPKPHYVGSANMQSAAFCRVHGMAKKKKKGRNGQFILLEPAVSIPKAVVGDLFHAFPDPVRTFHTRMDRCFFTLLTAAFTQRLIRPSAVGRLLPAPRASGGCFRNKKNWLPYRCRNRAPIAWVPYYGPNQLRPPHWLNIATAATVTDKHRKPNRSTSGM